MKKLKYFAVESVCETVSQLISDFQDDSTAINVGDHREAASVCIRRGLSQQKRSSNSKDKRLVGRHSSRFLQPIQTSDVWESKTAFS